MWVYIARRLMWLPFLLLAVALITFALGRFAPGDPIEVMLGQNYQQDVADRLRHEYGLDRPVYVQFVDYVWSALQGDFGESFQKIGTPVMDILAAKMWVSFQVNAVAMIVSLGIGLPLGFWLAHNQGSWKDPTTVAISLALMSIPIMVTIPLMTLVLCLKLGLVPCSGWGGFFDTRMIIPAITMGIPGIAGLARLMRASTLDVMGQDFIRTAHSKGLSSVVVDSRHILKNALIPIITILSFALAGMLTTSFITEQIFGIPGVGQFVIDSVFKRDYPVIMAVTLILATAFVLANLLADITYSIIDPRIRYK